jgi:hypothetical protein
MNERAREREREEEGDFKDYKRRGNWSIIFYKGGCSLFIPGKLQKIKIKNHLLF